MLGDRNRNFLCTVKSSTVPTTNELLSTMISYNDPFESVVLLVLTIVFCRAEWMEIFLSEIVKIRAHVTRTFFSQGLEDENLLSVTTPRNSSNVEYRS